MGSSIIPLCPRADKQFKKDVRSCQKSGKDLDKLWSIIEILCNSSFLKSKHKKHRLSGKYKNFWECHIEPDWLLIWDVEDIRLRLIRTGSHSELFG